MSGDAALGFNRETLPVRRWTVSRMLLPIGLLNRGRTATNDGSLTFSTSGHWRGRSR